jgi:hypothetical protein
LSRCTRGRTFGVDARRAAGTSPALVHVAGEARAGAIAGQALLAVRLRTLLDSGRASIALPTIRPRAALDTAGLPRTLLGIRSASNRTLPVVGTRPLRRIGLGAAAPGLRLISTTPLLGSLTTVAALTRRRRIGSHTSLPSLAVAPRHHARLDGATIAPRGEPGVT